MTYIAENDTHKLEITPDSNPINPRHDYTNTTMICFHDHYVLGDSHNYLTPEDFETKIPSLDIHTIKSLYLYDHGGITISTTPFSNRWDSGKVGYIYLTNEAMDDIKSPAKKVIDQEIKTYDQYLRGDVYKYQAVEKCKCNNCENVHENVIDSCAGFYGTDWKNNGLIDYIPAEFEVLIDDLMPKI